MSMNKPPPAVQRRLAAIFSADVAAYTRLMNRDEVSTFHLLGSHREVADRLIAQHGGRIANTAGDSILAEFPSASDALKCALQIQERIAVVNDEVPEGRRVSLRIGVHVGEAMVKNGDLFGDAVNVAARIQGLAEPGSVCLSGAAYEYVRTVLPLDFEDLGTQSVKNLDVPIRVYLARPLDRPRSRALPPVHRRVEAHLARRFHNLCHAALMDVMGPEDLKPLEFAIIASAHDMPGIDLAQLAERLGIDRATARSMVQRLQRRGYLEGSRGASGGRAKAFALTPVGVEFLQRLRPAHRSALDRVMAPLSDREREMLIDLLARVINTHAAKGGGG